MSGYFKTLPEPINTTQLQVVEVEWSEHETIKPKKPSWLVDQNIEPGDIIKFVSWISPKDIN